MKKLLFVISGLLVISIVSVLLYGNYMARKLPERSPENICRNDFRKGSRKVVVCLGDSITHGRVSANYMDILSEKPGENKFVFVNGGINGELAYNLLQRSVKIKACRPDYITILIGTNDVNAVLAGENSERYVKEMNLPRSPDKEWYRENLHKLCRKLKAVTGAKIALLSLPPIGEKLNSREIDKSREYSRVIKEVARIEKLTYLPLNEVMLEYLKKNPSVPVYDYGSRRRLMYTGIFKYYISGSSYDEIGKDNGHQLLTDFLHLNTRGAGMVAGLIEKFVKNNLE